ncbi:MAG TPA: DUF1295 domain-containing protein [Pseudomonadota bacterium]|jgi:steroid 5-alpha reductase family enzyme|nr:DUF1295 domain-containing protein [Pseudomonadota bacterium]
MPTPSWSLSSLLLLQFLVSLLLSAGGFFRIYYFVSLGYAFSIAALGLLTPFLLRASLDVATVLQSALLVLYGFRLGSFLIHRERSPVYQKELEEVRKRGLHIHGAVKWAIWISVAVLYVAMYSPATITMFFRREHPESVLFSVYAGLAVMVLGLFLETLADQQKSAYKRTQPKRFCDTGLYRYMRCPNYFGEVLFWTGTWISGLSAYTHVFHHLLAGAGYVCIVLVMLGSTRRLEFKQDERYGTDSEYQEYVRRVPILFPFLPVFSFRNLRVYLG